MLIGIQWGLLEVNDQPVNFIDDQNGFHAFLKSLLDDRERLCAHSLDCVDHNETAVTKTHLDEYVHSKSTAAETSELKSMWPGESTRLMR